jgi:Ca2+-binding RTX toxin-like protein
MRPMTHRHTMLCFALPAALAAAILVGPGVAQAKVSASLSGSLLTVTGGKGSDHITVLCRNGAVKVNGKDLRTGAIACSKVSEVDVLAAGSNDRVDLSGVGPDAGFGQRDLPGGFGHGTGAAAILGRGSDRYLGGASAFNLVLAGSGDDRMTGGRVRDSLQGGSGNDSAAGGAGRDVLLGNAGDDKLNGGADDDLLSGNAGNDLLNGAAGADLIGGGAGMDRLFGGAGPDRLIGGADKDRLNGGPGNNTLIPDFPSKK